MNRRFWAKNAVSVLMTLQRRFRRDHHKPLSEMKIAGDGIRTLNLQLGNQERSILSTANRTTYMMMEQVFRHCSQAGLGTGLWTVLRAVWPRVGHDTVCLGSDRRDRDISGIHLSVTRCGSGDLLNKLMPDGDARLTTGHRVLV